MRATWCVALLRLGVGLGLVAACGTERAVGPPSPVTPPQVRVKAPPCVLKVPDPRAGRAARARLLHDIDRYLSGRPGRIVFAAHDLATGVRLGRGEHEHGMITASGAKVDILAALLLSRTSLRAGEQELASRMIRESDNSAADALWWRVGAGGGMTGFYRRAGMRETVPGPSKFWGGTRTSPADRIRLLTLLVKGGAGLGAADRRLVLGLMSSVQREQAWGVSAAARPGDRVALKNGWTPRPFVRNTWAVTSYGRVSGPGRDLLLSVQTDQQAGEGQGIQAIEGLARLIGHRLAALTPVRAQPCAARPAAH
ncbi:serine hydrolase [Nonomuraea lactucae]|uniref:serine hydrolase n=1 Tax=Nonomuraea lactucae TaxID=2249762 RepID=UPI0013B46B05|nr:serine hydrolase [Nonomuraea lactucae]